MEIKSLYICFLMLVIVNTLSAQSILQQYFNGDTVKMLAEANKLVSSPDPVFEQTAVYIPDEKQAEETAPLNKYIEEQRFFTVRDNHKIFAYKYPAKSQNTILLLHGVRSGALKYLKTAHLLQKETGAEVYAIDFRGHGKSEGMAGDVDYINQYADDIADIISRIKLDKPNSKVILAGHSMGGGVALRYAMSKHEGNADGYILFAPLIGHDSPAFRQNSSGGEDSSGLFMQINIPRIIGLKMLNELGDHTRDSLPVLFFNAPANMLLRRYTYRANMSMAPDNYAVGLKAVDKPLLVLTGDKDEAFDPEKLKKAITENSKGETHIIAGAGHDDIMLNAEIFKLINSWFSKL